MKYVQIICIPILQKVNRLLQEGWRLVLISGDMKRGSWEACSAYVAASVSSRAPIGPEERTDFGAFNMWILCKWPPNGGKLSDRMSEGGALAMSATRESKALFLRSGGESRVAESRYAPGQVCNIWACRRLASRIGPVGSTDLHRNPM